MSSAFPGWPGRGPPVNQPTVFGPSGAPSAPSDRVPIREIGAFTAIRGITTAEGVPTGIIVGLGGGGVGVTVDLAGTRVGVMVGGERVLVGSIETALPAGDTRFTCVGSVGPGTAVASAAIVRERAQADIENMLARTPSWSNMRRLITPG